MDFVELYFKRNRGWPSLEESWGLSPMFGDGRWLVVVRIVGIR
jgi:hypothetical protein